MTHIPGLPLFDQPPPRYPQTAGFKSPTTSREAAEGIEASGKAGKLRRDLLALYRSGFTGTADEAAHALGLPDIDILSARPRCSELKARKLLARTGIRRPMDGGRMGHVLRLA